MLWNVGADYIAEKYMKHNALCVILELKPTNCVIFGLSNKVEDMKFNRGNDLTRLCISKLLVQKNMSESDIVNAVDKPAMNQEELWLLYCLERIPVRWFDYTHLGEDPIRDIFHSDYMKNLRQEIREGKCMRISHVDRRGEWQELKRQLYNGYAEWRYPME